MQRALVIMVVLIGICVAPRLSVAVALGEERAVLELAVNGVARGDVYVFLRGNDVLLPLKTLREVGVTRLEAATVDREGEPHVWLQAVKSGLAYQVDLDELSLSITASPSILQRTTINLTARSSQELEYEYDPSLFLNYAPRLLDGREFQGFAEAGLAAGAVVAESSATYDRRRRATRLRSSVSIDDRKHMRTAVLGDSSLSTGPLGSSVMIGGLSLARNYALDPYLIKIPRLGYIGETMGPATVDVYVNDRLLRRVPVEPGEFELTNITPVSGAGKVRYVLRDAFGRSRRLESAYYASSSVLAPGLSEYAYGIGLARESFGTESWSYGEPTLAGRHRVGLTRNLTLGYHLEFDRTRVNGGTELNLAGDFGEVELLQSVSSTTDEPSARGSAGLLGYAYRWDRGSVRSVVKVTSKDYATLTLDPSRDRALVEAISSAGWVLGSRANIATNLAFAWLRDSGPAARFGVTFNMRLLKALNLQIRATRNRTWLTAWEEDAFATLTWALPANHTAQLIGHGGSQQSDATARLARTAQARTDLGYELSGSVGTQNTRQAAAIVRGQSTVGRAAASYTYANGQQHTILEAAGGIVAVDGDLFFTLPVHQSFAVIDIPNSPGVRGYLNNRETGTTNSSGRLFVPGLLPFQANRLSINQADLPLDQGLEREESVLVPPTRGGAVVKFASSKLQIVRGRLHRIIGGEAKAVEHGTLRVRTELGVFVSPIGADGAFEFEGLPEGSWNGLARTPDGVCVSRFTITQFDHFLQDIGTVPCSEAGEQTRQP